MRQHLLLLLRCLSHRTGLVLSDWTGSDKSTWTEVAAFNLLNIFLTNEIHDWGLVLLFWLGWVMKCRSWTEEEKSPYPVGGRLMCFVKSCLVFSLKPGGEKKAWIYLTNFCLVRLIHSQDLHHIMSNCSCATSCPCPSAVNFSAGHLHAPEPHLSNGPDSVADNVVVILSFFSPQSPASNKSPQDGRPKITELLSENLVFRRPALQCDPVAPALARYKNHNSMWLTMDSGAASECENVIVMWIWQINIY